jgi:uncharacterized protein YkwD
MAYDPGAGRKILYNRRVFQKFWYLTTWIGLALASVGCAVQPLTPTPISAVAPPSMKEVSAILTPTFDSSVPSPTVILPPTDTAEPLTSTPELVSTVNAPTEVLPAMVTGDGLGLSGVSANTPPAVTTAETTLPPAAIAPPPSADVAAAEQYCIDLVNSERLAVGIAALARDETLMGIAQARVADMTARGYTGHNDPVTGEALGLTLMQAAGYTSSFLGENWYGTINPPPTIVDVAMTWFMTDPSHYRNILSPNYVAVGVGIGFNGQQWLLVQIFAGQ